MMVWTCLFTIRDKMAQCVALYEYAARDGEELTISKNENLTVLDSSGSWWRVKNEKGSVGLVPSNYVEKVASQQLSQPSLPQTSRTNLEKEEPVGMYHQPDLVRSNGPSLNIRALAKYKYVGTREDELSLEKGDEVIVMEKEADGWWRGRCGARIGWFPFNYVEEVAQGGGDPTPATLQPSEKSFACGVIALYSFNSGNPEELAFQKGDLMDIIDQPADDPDWWEARLADGTTGLVPRNYVEVVHDAEPVFGAGKPSGGPPRQQAAAAIPSLLQGSRPPPPFAHEPWYHGKVARRDAEALLNTQAQNGQFIVRSSETKVRLLNWKKCCDTNLDWCMWLVL